MFELSGKVKYPGGAFAYRLGLNSPCYLTKVDGFLMSSRKKPSLSAHEDAFKRTQLEGEPWRLDAFERQRWVLGYQLLKSTLTDQRLGCSLWCFICNTSRCWTVSLQPLLAARSRCRSCPALVGGQHLVKEKVGYILTGVCNTQSIHGCMESMA
jgi:hypothetical protein